MAIGITVNLERNAADLLTAYSAGAKVYLYSASSESGSYSLVTSTTIVAGTESYEFWDANGTTSTWYKTRVGNSGGSAFSDYSSTFRATALAAYATLDDLTETMNLPDASRQNLLGDLLADASNDITDLCGRDFFRHPQVSGTETRVYHVKRGGQRLLSRAIHEGVDIISITTLEIASTVSGSYTTIASGSTGYYLLPEVPATGFPYEDVMLSPEGSYTTFPEGGLVRIVGAFGFSAVPNLVKRATVDLARSWYREGPGGAGPQGINQFGVPVFGPGTPGSIRRLERSDYKRRLYLDV